MTNKDLYQKYCEQNAVPIFNQPWWLYSVCDDQWDVAVIKNQNEIIAALPYHIKKKGIHTIILPPQLTQYTELILNYPPGQKYVSKIGFEKDKISYLIEQLPQADYIELTLSPKLTNWLPFKWKGFIETSRYTYIIENLTDLEIVQSGFKDNIRREIRKAKKQLAISTSDDIELFYKINQKTFDRQKIKNPYPLDLFRKLDEKCKQQKCRTIYIAKDNEDNIHGSVYIVWDKKVSYYLAGGSDPGFRTSGAHSLLMWRAIQDAAKRNQSFDFKGSMIESVERFFRGFGAMQTPYFRLKKYNSKILKLILPIVYS
ncbi:MAG: GNAT family N-acetyltransferase [Flavobacteriales bacterium]|nr:GNAT family N-acetyltransferase [Flavobacteriales bacterium]